MAQNVLNAARVFGIVWAERILLISGNRGAG
jgi:hypothetical protein